MPCLIAALLIGFPRLIMIGLWLFSDFFSRGFQGVLWPLLGFLFAPLTTLAYGVSIINNGSVSGIYLALVILAVLMDLGFVGGPGLLRRTKK
jgi:hypothetical protein